jgi:hypothetical protein
MGIQGLIPVSATWACEEGSGHALWRVRSAERRAHLTLPDQTLQMLKPAHTWREMSDYSGQT